MQRSKLADAYARLTRRERQVLAWVAEGKTNAEIGQILDRQTSRAHFRKARGRKPNGCGARGLRNEAQAGRPFPEPAERLDPKTATLTRPPQRCEGHSSNYV